MKMLDYIVCVFGLQMDFMLMIVIVEQASKRHEVNKELLDILAFGVLGTFSVRAEVVSHTLSCCCEQNGSKILSL